MSGSEISQKYLKSLVELHLEIQENISNTDAMLISILKLVLASFCCKSASIIMRLEGDKNLLISSTGESINKKQAIIEENSVAHWVLFKKQSITVNDFSTDNRFNFKKSSRQPKNMLASPIILDGECIGVLELFNKAGVDNFENQDVEYAELFGAFIARSYENSKTYLSQSNIISRCSSDEQTETEIVDTFLGNSPMILEIEKIVDQISQTNTTILLRGEKGSGKKKLALRIHSGSSRKLLNFEEVLCVKKTSDYLAQEIFGKVSKGVYFPGAISKANGGTIFFNEISSLPLEIQDKLYSFIQSQSFYPVDGIELVKCDVRIIASSSKNLEGAVETGCFRENLFFRLNVLPLNVPPLRKHCDDIILLAQMYLEISSRKFHKDVHGFSYESMEAMKNYHWPMNLYELKNVVETGCMNCITKTISISDLTNGFASGENRLTETSTDGEVPSDDRSLKSAVNGFKKFYVKKILKELNWNQTAASRVLDVQRTYVSKLVSELGIQRD